MNKRSFHPAFDTPVTVEEALAVIEKQGDPLCATFSANKMRVCYALLSRALQPKVSGIVTAWIADPDPLVQRRMGKTLEELGELVAVCARIKIQGLDAIDPASGKTNRQRLIDESADVLAQLSCNGFALDLDQGAINIRMCEKMRQMEEWEKLLREGKPG